MEKTDIKRVNRYRVQFHIGVVRSEENSNGGKDQRVTEKVPL